MRAVADRFRRTLGHNMAARVAAAGAEVEYFLTQCIELYYQAGYSLIMTTKQKVMKAVEALPGDASFEDAMERLLFLAKVEKGIQQADAGQTIPHETFKQNMQKWLK